MPATRRSNPEDTAKHQQKRGVLIERAKDKLDQKDIKFLRDYLMKRLPSNLDNALRSLITSFP
jgi:hypothetical protein